MSEVYSTACVMLIPNDASGDEHLTLCYCGEIVTGVALNQISDRIRFFAQWFPHVTSWVDYWDVFDNGKVDVAVLERSQELVVARSWFEEFSFSEHGFTPHISAEGPLRRPVGQLVTFNRIGLWAGGEQINYRLGSGTLCS